jgi:hypothetical protein
MSKSEDKVVAPRMSRKGSYTTTHLKESLTTKHLDSQLKKNEETIKPSKPTQVKE